ncbi:MAG TPA: tetratricopeptide repeat protein [Desulfobacteria bacterium]|nr:tetratricopeptide repeat protein [Desulfobacteria bacterium]
MENGRVVSRNKALALIAVFTAILIVTCGMVGYKVYWVWQAKRPQIVKDQAAYEYRVRVNPRDVEAHLNLGKIYELRGMKEKALIEYHKVLELDKNNLDAMFQTGLMAKESGDYKEAERRMRAILNQNSRYEGASYTLAQIYRESKQYAKAKQQYERALEVSPGSADIMIELGLLYEAQGKKVEALRQYRTALLYAPDLKKARDGVIRLTGKS